MDRVADDQMNGREQERGAGGIAAGDRGTPLLRPVLADGCDGVAGYAAEEGGLIQQRMADAAVAPIEQGESAAVAGQRIVRNIGWAGRPSAFEFDAASALPQGSKRTTPSPVAIQYAPARVSNRSRTLRCGRPSSWP